MFNSVQFEEALCLTMSNLKRLLTNFMPNFIIIQPISRRGVNNFEGLGASIIDSLNTLYIMGLHEQFQKG